MSLTSWLSKNGIRRSLRRSAAVIGVSRNTSPTGLAQRIDYKVKAEFRVFF